MSPWIEAVPYVASYRALLDTHLQRLLDAHNAGGLTQPVPESECEELLTQLRQLKAQWPQQEAGPDPRAPIEAVARDVFASLGAHIDLSAADCVRLWLLLDLLNTLSDNELCEPALAFWLVEELLDSQTIDGCKRVFDYLESRRQVMTAHFFREKSLVILRCCNELLRRLSRAEDTVFCGRVFIFLFQSFPLGDKSSVNLRGEFHVENVTDYDPAPAPAPMDIDSDGGPVKAVSAASAASAAPTPADTPLDADATEPAADLDALYPIFWALQSLFSSPTRLFDPAAMAQLKEGLALTLSCFRSIHDLAFRRHVLVQSLIMLDFLLSLSPAAKAKAAAAPGLTNKSVLYGHTLSEDDTKWCIQTRAAMASYLQQQGSGNEGKMYYRMVDTVLSRDKNWVRWKGESCPPITRRPVEVDSFLAAQATLQRIASDATRPLLNPPGAKEFDFLLRPTTTESLKHPRRNGRYKIPTLHDFHTQIQSADLDMDFATTEMEKKDIEERKMGNVWRALRASAESGQRVKLADALGEQGTNYNALAPNTTKHADEGTPAVKDTSVPAPDALMQDDAVPPGHEAEAPNDHAAQPDDASAPAPDTNNNNTATQ
ncbi:hypothetical protein DV737_g1884, partial [Chaetothyriales sp. CBS 132003]